jgi:antitoxin ParD1/3/4
MTTMNISLPDEMRVFIEEQVSSEGYASASEYFRALVRDAQKRQGRVDLEAKLREALVSGPAAHMTSEDWQELERRVWDRERNAQPRNS